MTQGGCPQIEVRLSEWIDAELDAAAAAEVREHLAVCASCRRRHALLVAAGRAVRSLPGETVSAGFEQAFRQRLAATRTAAKGARARRRLAATAGLAAAVALVILGTVAWHRNSPRGEAPAPVAAQSQLDTPCASAAVCRVASFDREPSASHAPLAVVPPGAPCASAATCGVVSVVSAAAAGRFAETGRDN